MIKKKVIFNECWAPDCVHTACKTKISSIWITSHDTCTWTSSPGCSGTFIYNKRSLFTAIMIILKKKTPRFPTQQLRIPFPFPHYATTAPLFESQIVGKFACSCSAMVGWWWGRVEGIKIFVILFYAPDGERRSSAPLRRAAHLKKRTGAPQDSSRCSHLRVLTIGVLGRIKAEYFNLAPEFTWLCQSNYLTPAERKREKEKKMQLRKQ